MQKQKGKKAKTLRVDTDLQIAIDRLRIMTGESTDTGAIIKAIEKYPKMSARIIELEDRLLTVTIEYNDLYSKTLEYFRARVDLLMTVTDQVEELY